MRLDDLPGIQKVIGIDCTLDPSHEVEFDRCLVAGKLVPFHLAYTVLGAEAATEVVDQIVNNAIGLGCSIQEMRCVRSPRRRRL